MENNGVALSGTIKSICDECEGIVHKMYAQVVDIIKKYGGEYERINLYPNDIDPITHDFDVTYIQSIEDDYGKILTNMGLCAIELTDKDIIQIYLIDGETLEYMVYDHDHLTDEDLDNGENMSFVELCDDLSSLEVLHNILNVLYMFVKRQESH